MKNKKKSVLGIFILIIFIFAIFVLVLLKKNGKINLFNKVNETPNSNIQSENENNNKDKENDNESVAYESVGEDVTFEEAEKYVEATNMHIFGKDENGFAVLKKEDKSIDKEKVKEYVFTMNVKNISGEDMQDSEFRCFLKNDSDEELGYLPFHFILKNDEEICLEMKVNDKMKDATKFELKKVNYPEN